MRTLDLKTHPLSELVAEVSQALKNGGLIIFPTETTYGAGVLATNQAAVNKLLQFKSRREGKPLSIAVTDQNMAEQYVELNDSAKTLYRQFLPGPVTVVSRGLGKVAQGVESEFGTLGVRIPDYPLVLQLVAALGLPITATSANASGAKRPYSITDVMSGLSEKQKQLIDIVIDAGQLPPNPPSTVIDTTLSTPTTLRAGEVTWGDPQSILTLLSRSEAETQSIAGRLILKNWDAVQATGLIIELDGSLGAGKTIFTKGVAAFLQIPELLTSPTYTYLESYLFHRHQTQGSLHHLDLWKINSAEELARLEIESLLKPNQVVVIEWYQQVEKWLAPLLQKLALPQIRVVLRDHAVGRELQIQETAGKS